MQGGQKTVTSALVKRGMRSALKAGIGPPEFQRLTGISEAEADQAGGRIVDSKYISMLNIVERLPNPCNLAVPDPGDDWAEPLTSMIAVVSNAPDLRTAFTQCVALRPLIGEVDGMIFRQVDARFEFRFLLDGQARTPLMALSSFQAIVMLAQVYGGPLAAPPVIELAGEKEPGWQELIAAAGCKIHFGKSENRLLFSAPWAEAPWPQHNKIIYEVFCKKTNADLRALRERHAFHAKVTAFLTELLQARQDVYGEQNMLMLTCHRFDLSRSGLHRRLQKEETNFQKLLAAARINEAKRLLLENALPSAEIGDVLGFSSQSVFCRFFSDHTGISPSRYKVIHCE